MSNVKKCSVVSICGAPNVGKSTLINALVGKKVSIVSNKPQTTRSRFRGIRTEKQTQLIFVDSPGIFKPSGKLNNRLNRSIVETAKNSIDGSDFSIFVFDATKNISQNEKDILKNIKNLGAKILLVINKIDLVEKQKLLKIATEFSLLAEFEQVFMISASDRDGTDDILEYLLKNAPKSEWLYPKNAVSDVENKFFASEITREKLFNNLREELPYGIMIQTEKYEEEKSSVSVYQSIVCLSEEHKKIIIGKKGMLLKKIGQSARLELEKIFEKKVSLYLYVKVREDWIDKKESYLEQHIDFSR
jgi:GTP-binding protein Era